MRPKASSTRPSITIRVSGELFRGHLSYLDQLVESAVECELWAKLDLSRLAELDEAAISYLIAGEERKFSILSCPGFARAWMDREKARQSAA